MIDVTIIKEVSSIDMTFTDESTVIETTVNYSNTTIDLTVSSGLYAVENPALLQRVSDLEDNQQNRTINGGIIF